MLVLETFRNPLLNLQNNCSLRD